MNNRDVLKYMLTFFSIPSIGRMQQTCKFAYEVGNDDAVWKTKLNSTQLKEWERSNIKAKEFVRQNPKDVFYAVDPTCTQTAIASAECAFKLQKFDKCPLIPGRMLHVFNNRKDAIIYADDCALTKRRRNEAYEDDHILKEYPLIYVVLTENISHATIALSQTSSSPPVSLIYYEMLSDNFQKVHRVLYKGGELVAGGISKMPLQEVTLNHIMEPKMRLSK